MVFQPVFLYFVFYTRISYDNEQRDFTFYLNNIQDINALLNVVKHDVQTRSMFRKKLTFIIIFLCYFCL